MNWLDSNHNFMAKPNVAWADLLLFFSIEKDPNLRKEAAKLLNLPELPEDFWIQYQPKSPPLEEDVGKPPLEKIIPKNIQRKPLQVPHFWVSEMIEKSQAPAPKALDFSNWTKQDSEEVLKWQMPFYEPLMQSQYLWTMHHKEVQNFKKKSFQLPVGKQLDLNELIKKLSVAQWPVQMPQKDLSYRAKKILVLIDWSEHLRVYKYDVLELFAQLKKQCAPIELELDSIENGPLGNLASNGKNLRSLVTPNAAAVLIISDLAENQANLQNKWWNDTIKVLKKRFNHLAVLNPNKAFIKPENLQKNLSNVEILLAALSPALTIEPRLIRELRLAILPSSSAELENQIWESKDLVGNLPARQWVTQKKLEHYNNFQKLDKNIRLKIAQTISDCHAEFNQLQKDEENFMAWSQELIEEDQSSENLASKIDLPTTIKRLEKAAMFLAFNNQPNLEQQLISPELTNFAAESRISRISVQLLDQYKNLSQALFKAAENNKPTKLPHGISDQVLEFTPLEQEITIHVYVQGTVLIFENEIAEVISKKTTQQLLKKIKLATLQLKTDQLLVNILGQKHIINIKSIDPILEIPIKNQARQLQLTKDDIQINWSAGSIQIKQIKRPMGVLGWEQTKDTLMVKILTITGSVDYLEWPTDQFKATHSEAVAIPKTNTQPNELLKKDSHGVDEFGVYYDLTIREVTQRFRYIPPGTFLMGAPESDEHAAGEERPQHPVIISEGYWLADTPCTQELWQTVIGDNPSQFSVFADSFYRPVENIVFKGNKNSVEAFLKELAQYFPSNLTLTIPTEAQWEYACRAGTKTAYWWGNHEVKSMANTASSLNTTTPVFSYAPNPWGLFDMHGNVWEWCLDDGLSDYTNQVCVDPLEDKSHFTRVSRGGAWNSDMVNARATVRFPRVIDRPARDLGVRILLSSLIKT